MTESNDKPKARLLLGDTDADDAAPEDASFELRGSTGFASQIIAARLEPGDVVADKYRIVSHIARGGMGNIFRAEHIETGEHVALKLMDRGDMTGDRAQKRFQLEAKNAAGLKHPNTVRTLDFGMQGVPYLALELVEGETIEAVVKREGPMAWSRVVRIAEQVLGSLQEAHEHARRVVHRDIKPSNILLQERPDHPDFVKVLDFGVSRAMDGTTAGSIGIVGSPMNMAPEQWDGSEVSPQTDLYALGCTAYEMLAGKPVFEAANPIVLGFKHLHEVPRPLGELAAADTPEALIAWVHQMMAKVPSDRPDGARGALEALAEVAA